MSPRQRKPPVTPCPSNPPSTLTQISNAASTLEEKVEHTFLIFWDDLPHWQRDNHYIHSGYRRASNSYLTSLRSLTYLHNESVNIWSHLLGAIISLFVAVALYGSLAPRYETASQADVCAFSCFFLGAAGCLGMSATYHAISNHSPSVASWGNKLDYVGIVLLIWGSFVASIYYGFACHPHLRIMYWTMVGFHGHIAVVHVVFLLVVFQSLNMQISKLMLKIYGVCINRSLFWESDVPLSRSCPSFVRRHGDRIVRRCSSPWACRPCSLSCTVGGYMALSGCGTRLGSVG